MSVAFAGEGAAGAITRRFSEEQKSWRDVPDAQTGATATVKSKGTVEEPKTLEHS